jgi:hypothetical protein
MVVLPLHGNNIGVGRGQVSNSLATKTEPVDLWIGERRSSCEHESNWKNRCESACVVI